MVIGQQEENFRKCWVEWMMSGEKSLTPGGALRRPTLAIVTEWVKHAWDLIPTEMVIKSFKKCGISNELDGSEDDILYEELVSETAETTEADIEEAYERNIDYYDTHKLTDEQVRELFDSDNDSDEEFEGFAS